MGLFQNLIDTYEKCSAAVGIVQTDADGNANEKKTLLPVFHMTFKSAICITIDSQGRFVSASRDANDTTIIIPCTEESAGRSNDKVNPKPHPLCDQLDYIAGLKDTDCKEYLAQLSTWKGSISELCAIYIYVSNNTILSDLLVSEIFKPNRRDDKDGIYKGGDFNDYKEGEERTRDKEKIRKIGVRFIVQNKDNAVKVWDSIELRNAWFKHINCVKETGTSCFDYLSGEMVRIIASQHPKNINSLTGNAKLLSCNDTSGFTFKGRFPTQNDAIITDYAKSQQMHQMLRWLISNYGYAVDSQVIVTWAVESKTEVKAKSQDNSFDLFSKMETIQTQADILAEAAAQVYSNYAEKIRNLLQGLGNANKAKQHARKICVAAFDAATTGRMGLVFYQELAENEYLQDIVDWHHDTSYFLTAWKYEKQEKGKDKAIPVHYIGAPSYDDILFAVYGKGHGDQGYDVLKKKVRKQLLECMFGNFPFPKSMVDMAAIRASHPMSFSDSDGRFVENDWRRSINITCALVRKYYKQQLKGELSMTLDEMQKDRSYLYGRWLAIADKVEEAALRSQGKQKERATNAVRFTSSFSVKPFTTKLLISEQLNPYRNQINSLYKNFFLPIITEIDEKLEVFTDNNERLSPLYLLGYSSQYKALSKSGKYDNSEVNDNGDTAEQD